MINPIKKGKAGEVEFCKWIKRHLDIDTERNYNQSQGGADIIIDDFIFEIKRRESLDLDSWWMQLVAAKSQHKNRDLIPVVAYRQNRKRWNFLIPAAMISGLEIGYVIANEKVFIKLAKLIVDKRDDEDAR